MARTVRWTEAATEDLSEVVQFIARDAPFYAAALVRQARAAALSLRNSPRRGRIVPESGDPDIREIFLKSFRLIYQITDDSIFVLTFVHGARDLTALWDELLVSEKPE